jgi:hypothetical protein
MFSCERGTPESGRLKCVVRRHKFSEILPLPVKPSVRCFTLLNFIGAHKINKKNASRSRASRCGAFRWVIYLSEGAALDAVSEQRFNNLKDVEDV